MKSQPSRSRTRPGDGDRTPIPEPDSPAGVPKAHARRRVDSPVPGRERETEEPARACLGLLFAGKFFFLLERARAEDDVPCAPAGRRFRPRDRWC